MPLVGTTLTIALLLGEQVTIAMWVIAVPISFIRMVEFKDWLKTILWFNVCGPWRNNRSRSQKPPSSECALKSYWSVRACLSWRSDASNPKSGYMMLCSDGLWGVVPENDLYRSISSQSDPLWHAKKWSRQPIRMVGQITLVYSCEIPGYR